MKVKAIIEMPAYTNYKYEAKNGKLILDRILNVQVPCNYGYFPGTLEKDGDPADCFVFSSTPLYPLSELDVEILGGFSCVDNGVQDDKLFAKIYGDFSTNIGAYDIAFIRNYLTTYKAGFEIIEQFDKEEALKAYRLSLTKESI